MPEDTVKTHTQTRQEGEAIPPQALCAHATLARQERTAALRALAGRLAHQIRNPLAAIHAACGSLRAELDDPDHQHRLDLTLQEVDRVLMLVSATVNAVTDAPEPARDLDLVQELRDVVRLQQQSRNDPSPVHLGGVATVPCRLPPNRLRVALYSLLDHLIDTMPRPLSIEIRHTADRCVIQFLGADENAEDAPPQLQRFGEVQDIGILVAERFARDTGGRLSRTAANGGRGVTLELACHYG